jgi:hypothetical protein
MNLAFRVLLLVLSVSLVPVAALAEGTPIPGVKPPPPPPVHRRAPDYPHAWPPYGGPTVPPPAAIPLPPPPSTNDLTTAIRRDQLQRQIDPLRQQNSLGTLGPSGQRDLMMREQELHQLDTGVFPR